MNLDISNIKDNREKKVAMNKIISEFDLETLYLPEFSDKIFIKNKDIERPGLYLSGYYECFDKDKIQVIDKAEYNYLSTLDNSERDKALDLFFSYKPVLVMITKDIDSYEDLIDKAKKYQVPLLKIEGETGNFLAELLTFLNIEMARTIAIHGGMMEVYGEGILILGESGIGKSETAVELMKRGHRLVADDIVEIKRVAHNILIGTSPENIRYFLEIRGLGIINARQIFGFGAVRLEKSISLVVKLEKWDDNKFYDRVGIDKEYTKILNINVPTIILPVKEGRTIAAIIEIAAINYRQTQMGFNAPEQLLKKVGYTEKFDDEIC